VHRFLPSRTILRTAGVAVAVFALGVATAGGIATATQPGKRHATINTKKDWASFYITHFGCPSTTTYGQVITIPAGKTSLNRFAFWMNDFGARGSMVARGELYAWDGSEATGSALFESKPRTISFHDHFAHREGFQTGGAAVNAGSQYVIFVSIDKDYESCTFYGIAWGVTQDLTYPGGRFVYLDSHGDESMWTSSGWELYSGDAAFKAFMS
jgi:hypothetical protein